ncbi:MAG: DUF2237 family protein [Paracoccaceae bacterium]
MTTDPSSTRMEPSTNVLGGDLAPCSMAPLTGYFRDGACNTCAQDTGAHTVCAVVTAEFLAFSRYVGNDFSTPRPEYGFAGLKPGDRWCLCASRFMQAHDEGCAPGVVLSATHARAADIVPIQVLQEHAIDGDHV